MALATKNAMMDMTPVRHIHRIRGFSFKPKNGVVLKKRRSIDEHIACELIA